MTATTLLLGAVPWEVIPIHESLTESQTGELSGFPYWRGNLAGADVVVAITGVGKTNAAMIASLFIAEFSPVRLLYTGSAARVNKALRTGDVILGQKTVHHDCGTLRRDGMLYRKIIGPVPGVPTNYQFRADADLLAAAIDAAKDYQPKKITANGSTYLPAVRPGIICSGDVFGMTEKKLSDIRTKLKADLVEMEGSAIGQVCTALNLPHLVIRGGSNLAQENPGNDYKRLGQIAARSSAAFTLHLFKHLVAGKKA